MNIVTCKRLLGFCAGPENETFYACEPHRAQLEQGTVLCFFELRGEPVQEIEPADDADNNIEDCYFCREG